MIVLDEVNRFKILHLLKMTHTRNYSIKIYLHTNDHTIHQSLTKI